LHHYKSYWLYQGILTRGNQQLEE